MKYGFQFFDDETIINITDVKITSEDSIEVTLDKIPTSAKQRLSYSARSDLGNKHAGGSNNKHFHGGNLRDSDLSVSPSINSTKMPLYNWGISFTENVN